MKTGGLVFTLYQNRQIIGRIVGETCGGKYLVRELTAPRHILVRSSEELREITGEGNEADSIARDAD